MVPMEKNTDKYTHSTPAAPPQLSHLGFPTRTSSLILVDKKPSENWTSQLELTKKTLSVSTTGDCLPQQPPWWDSDPLRTTYPVPSYS